MTNDEICAAIKDLFEDTRSIAEPSGALAIAGAKKWLAENKHTDATVAAIASGANMNFEVLLTTSKAPPLVKICLNAALEAHFLLFAPSGSGW